MRRVTIFDGMKKKGGSQWNERRFVGRILPFLEMVSRRCTVSQVCWMELQEKKSQNIRVHSCANVTLGCT